MAATALTPTSQEQVQVRGPQARRRRARALPGARPRGRCAPANRAAPDAPSLGTVSIISYIQNNAQTAELFKFSLNGAMCVFDEFPNLRVPILHSRAVHGLRGAQLAEPRARGVHALPALAYRQRPHVIELTLKLKHRRLAFPKGLTRPAGSSGGSAFTSSAAL